MSRVPIPNRLIVSGLVSIITASLIVGCQTGAPQVVETPPPSVSVATPVVRTVMDFREFVGFTEAIETVEVRARVEGYLDEVNFNEGETVAQGQVLFVIDPREYQADYSLAEAKLEQSKAQAKLAAVERQRYGALAQRDVGSRQDFDRADASYNVAVAEIRGAEAELERARLNVGFTEIRSPITGRASRRNVDVGNLVTPGTSESTPLTTIVSEDPYYVYFDVDQNSLLDYSRRAQVELTSTPGERVNLREANIPIEMGLSDEAGYPRVGVLEFSDNQINPSTGTIRVWASFVVEDLAVRPGLFSRVRVPTGEPREGILVVDRAIGSDQGAPYLYVVDETGTAIRTDVEVGQEYSGLRVIRSGLGATDRVIVNGIQRVRDQLKLEPVEIPMPIPPGAEEALGIAADGVDLKLRAEEIRAAINVIEEELAASEERMTDRVSAESEESNPSDKGEPVTPDGASSETDPTENRSN